MGLNEFKSRKSFFIVLLTFLSAILFTIRNTFREQNFTNSFLRYLTSELEDAQFPQHVARWFRDVPFVVPVER